MKNVKWFAVAMLCILLGTFLVGCRIKSGTFAEACVELPDSISCQSTTFNGNKTYTVLIFRSYLTNIGQGIGFHGFLLFAAYKLSAELAAGRIHIRA